MTARWERREIKQRSVRGRQPRHGGALAEIYANAVIKRAGKKKRAKRRR